MLIILRLNASKVGTGTIGKLEANAIPFAAVIPILSPVKEPGPIEIATQSNSFGRNFV